MDQAPPLTDALLEVYRAAHYDVELADGTIATLRVGHQPPPAVVEWIGADAFAVYLTACNPGSQPLPEASNATRMTALRNRLRELEARWLEGRGHMPGDAWSEPSVLVTRAPLTVVDRLARAFGQNAVVHVALDARARLRVYSDNRAASASASDIDWIVVE